jgi:hypothetical protein
MHKKREFAEKQNLSLYTRFLRNPSNIIQLYNVPGRCSYTTLVIGKFNFTPLTSHILWKTKIAST